MKSVYVSRSPSCTLPDTESDVLPMEHGFAARRALEEASTPQCLSRLGGIRPPALEVRFVEQSSAVLMIGFEHATASQNQRVLYSVRRGYSCASKGRVGPDLDFDQTLAG